MFIIIFEEIKMLSRIEMYISYAIFELLSQQRCVSLLAILDILNRKLQEGGHSESEHLAILNAIKEVEKNI